MYIYNYKSLMKSLFANIADLSVICQTKCNT